MKKTIVTFLAAVLIFSTTAMSYGAEYTDVRYSSWAYDAVSAMSTRMIVNGYPDGSFKPNNTVTYGEFIKMALIAATGEGAGNATSGHWATNYYNKALELKYFTNADILKTQLGDQITRGDMALIISSILGDMKIENYDELQKSIKDVNYQTKHEYDITKAYAAGILTGYPDSTFRPDLTLSRAESATVIYRLVDESKRELPGAKETDTGYKLVTLADYVDVSTVADVKQSNTGDFTKTAELYNDASAFDMKINKAWTPEWGCSFFHSLNGFIYLVKDGKIAAWCRTLPRYDADGNFLYSYASLSPIDVTKADYIICVSANVNTNILTKIVPNPFK